MAFNSVTVQAIVTLIDNLNDLYAEQEIRLTGPAAFSLSSGGDVAEVEWNVGLSEYVWSA